MDATSVLRRPDHTTSQVVAEEAILIHLDTGTYFSLNKIGTEFWEALDGRKTIAEHAPSLAGKYAVDEQMVVGDLIELAEEMAGQRLVDLVEGSA